MADQCPCGRDDQVTVCLADQINDLKAVVDHEFARSRYISADVATAYAELQAERGDVVPMAELQRRRELAPPPPRPPNPWAPWQLTKFLQPGEAP